MRTYNIHEAKTHLSRLIERAAGGEAFVIAKAGKPMVKVVAIDAAEAPRRKRIGFLAGRIKVPADFDDMGAADSGEHAAGVARLPSFHKDPFDRMLISQATCEGITLLTSDAKVARYDGPILRV